MMRTSDARRSGRLSAGSKLWWSVRGGVRLRGREGGRRVGGGGFVMMVLYLFQYAVSVCVVVAGRGIS